MHGCVGRNIMCVAESSIKHNGMILIKLSAINHCHNPLEFTLNII